MGRIDVELVTRNHFDTRSKAQFAIASGIVFCNGKKILKNSFLVKENDQITVSGNPLQYVSKGGLKLEKALKEFLITLQGKKMIDIGASTGGFSDCALQNGIREIIAIDVGTLQFSQKLLKSNKIILMENTDFRYIDSSLLSGYTIATIDVSFISVKKLIKKISELNELNEIILLIKPQFECGIEIAKKYSGVVLDKSVHINVINNVINCFNSINYGLQNLTYSPIRGGSGNIEYLGYFKKKIDNNKNILPNKVVKEAFLKLITK